MTQHTELKPCPFCGGEARYGHDNMNGHYVTCANIECGVLVVARYHETKELTITAWNTRHD